MKITLSKYQFIDEFRQAREDLKNAFSYDGLRTVFDYLEQEEEETGEEREFDPIDITEEFTEYGSIKEFKKERTEYEDKEIETLEDVKGLVEVLMPIEGSEGFIVRD